MGPYQLRMGKTSYHYLGGISMAILHVAGIAALMAEKNNALRASEVEGILESTVIPLGAGCPWVWTPYGYQEEYGWGADATGARLATVDAALAATP